MDPESGKKTCRHHFELCGGYGPKNFEGSATLVGELRWVPLCRYIIYRQREHLFFSGGRANARNVCDFLAPFHALRKKEPTMAGGERGGIMGVGLMKNFTDADTFLDWMRCGRGRQTSHGPSACLSGFFSWQVLGPPPMR